MVSSQLWVLQPIHCEWALVFVRFAGLGEGTGADASAKPAPRGNAEQVYDIDKLAVAVHSIGTTIDEVAKMGSVV